MNTRTNATRPSTLRYSPGLDGLRAVSVLAVVVFHHYLIGGHEAGWAPGGFLGVEVFFVVSGYLITSLLLSERRETGRVSLRVFYIRRARRLLPAVFALLAGVIVYSLLFLPDAIGTLRSDAVAEAFARKGVAVLKADWTNRDAGIAEMLGSFGRSGVPLYLLYAPTLSGRAAASAPAVLPQILTEGVVIDAVNKI